MPDPIYVLAVLGALIAVSEWLVRKTWLRHLGSALLVIVLTSVAANVGIVPTYSSDQPIYSGIFSYLGPLAIFWLLLGVDLRKILDAGAPMLALFLIGSFGTMAGVLVGMLSLGGPEAFGELYHALGGMFVGTYTGGSINFNAVAMEYGLQEQEPTLFAGASVVDSAMTTVWMAATVAIPRLLSRFARFDKAATVGTGEASTGEVEDTESVHHVDFAVLLFMGAASLWFSGVFVAWLAGATGLELPSTIVLTTISLILAQTRFARSLRGARVLGMISVMFFLAVIGALCDLAALREIGPLGVKLSIFVVIVVVVHGSIAFGAAFLLRLDPALAAVASQANIGGGTSALALSRSLGRSDLTLPAILMGSLGTAIGNYLGSGTAWFLQRF